MRLRWGVAVAVLAALLATTALAGVRWRAGTPSSAIEWVCGADADRTSPADRLLPPLAPLGDGGRSLAGTDELGRSLGLRLCLALGTSLLVAGCAAAAAMVIGTLVGTWSGLAGGRTDDLLMRLTEASAGIPAVVVVMVLAAALSPYGMWPVLAAMGVLFWQPVARVVRARVLALRNELYVEASRACGSSAWWRLRRHILPATAPTVFAYGGLLLPRLIMLEALLAFLGVSAAAAPHSFGRIIAGVTATLTPLSASWWPVLVPCLALAALLLVLNLALDRLAETHG